MSLEGVIGAPCNENKVGWSLVSSTFSSSIVTRRETAVDDLARGRNLGTNAMIGVSFLLPDFDAPLRDDSDGNLHDMSVGGKDELLPALVCGVE